MKKLIYNKNTKEIDIVEEQVTEDCEKTEKENMKKEPKGFKLWLENNKIFFEVFSYFFVGIMGIIISFVGWQTNIRTEKIYQRQLKILDNDREPYFTIHCEPILERFESKDNYYIKKLYTIKNEGGLINGAFLYGVRGYAIIFLVEAETKTEKVYKLYIPEMFETIEEGISLYDEENKEFSFYGYEGSKYDKFENELSLKLNELFKEYNVSVYFENYVDIIYVNYKNEECSHTYKFLGKRMTLVKENMEEKRVFIGGIKDVYNTEDIANDVYKIIKEMEKK